MSDTAPENTDHANNSPQFNYTVYVTTAALLFTLKCIDSNTLDPECTLITYIND